MTTPAERRQDLVHPNLPLLRTQADAGQVRFDLLEDTGHNHRFDGPDMIDEPFAVVGLRPGADVIGLAQPDIGGAIPVRQPETVIHVPEQPNPRQRERLVDNLANPRHVRPELHQLPRRRVGLRKRARILKRSRVGRDRREQTVGNGGCHRPARKLQQPKISSPVEGTRDSTQFRSPYWVLLW
jgi:hypothetical protein